MKQKQTKKPKTNPFWFCHQQAQLQVTQSQSAQLNKTATQALTTQGNLSEINTIMTQPSTNTAFPHQTGKLTLEFRGIYCSGSIC